MSLFKSVVFLFFLSITVSPTYANEARAADREQLLAMLVDTEQAINNHKLELFIRQFDERATVTWLNAEVSVGPEGVRDYYHRMIGDHKDAILSDYKTWPTLSGPARFYGNVAVANGTMRDEFTPHGRGQFSFDSTWTATLYKNDDQWKIITLNFSTNSFDNALTEELKGNILFAGISGLLCGGVMVTLVLIWRRRKNN